jgi:hypothetical protein
MRLLIKILFILLSFAMGPQVQAEIPDLQSGDLIFQTSLSPQSRVIQIATGSKYSHVGIVEVSRSGQIFVIEALAQVSQTELSAWIARGSGSKFTVFRMIDLTPAQLADFISAAKTYIGRNYDIYFSRENDEIYCSELVDYAARDIGTKIGRYQKFGTLNVNNRDVIDLARARWQGHPLCQGVNSFEECWPRMLEDEMVTPVSLTEDGRAQQIYSNY